jgi:hypothetical protein
LLYGTALRTKADGGAWTSVKFVSIALLLGLALGGVVQGAVDLLLSRRDLLPLMPSAVAAVGAAFGSAILVASRNVGRPAWGIVLAASVLLLAWSLADTGQKATRSVRVEHALVHLGLVMPPILALAMLTTRPNHEASARNFWTAIAIAGAVAGASAAAEVGALGSGSVPTKDVVAAAAIACLVTLTVGAAISVARRLSGQVGTTTAGPARSA